MGLNINGARFLLAEKKRGISLGRLLTLGRQEVYMTNREYDHVLKEVNVKKNIETFGDDFFLGLGASSLEIMDASDYEGADIIHDLNEPISADLTSRYDTVIDGGTLEHVFHFPNSIRTCMELVKPGGQLILITPWHNYPGHGFYQFSPELFYSILSSQNGYNIERMMIVSDGHWYEIRNPSEIKQRIEISCNAPIDLHISAKRIGSGEIFAIWPQQSDYSVAWKEGSYGVKKQAGLETFKERLVNSVPIISHLQKVWRSYKRNKKISPSNNTGMIKRNPSNEIPF